VPSQAPMSSCFCDIQEGGSRQNVLARARRPRPRRATLPPPSATTRTPGRRTLPSIHKQPDGLGRSTTTGLPPGWSPGEGEPRLTDVCGERAIGVEAGCRRESLTATAQACISAAPRDLSWWATVSNATGLTPTSSTSRTERPTTLVLQAATPIAPSLRMIAAPARRSGAPVAANERTRGAPALFARRARRPEHVGIRRREKPPVRRLSERERRDSNPRWEPHRDSLRYRYR
jgi:hypothetical protein